MAVLLATRRSTTGLLLHSRRLYSAQSRPKPLSAKEREELSPMIRVDQSGEVGAYYIYMGQMAVLGRDKKLRPILQEMWDQEKKHLERFDDLVVQHRVRPSLLRPLWEVAGFAVGAGTALLGKEAAMACTEAVETVIGNHYDDQLRHLVELSKENKNPDLNDLSKVNRACRVSWTTFVLTPLDRPSRSSETRSWSTTISPLSMMRSKPPSILRLRLSLCKAARQPFGSLSGSNLLNFNILHL